MPYNNQFYFCPANGSSCYYYVRSNLAFSAAKANCQNRGGDLVAYNTGDRLGSLLYACAAVSSLLSGNA